MKAEDILGLLIPVTFVFFLITERLFPRRRYPPIRFWNLIGFACLIMLPALGHADGYLRESRYVRP